MNTQGRPQADISHDAAARAAARAASGAGAADAAAQPDAGPGGEGATARHWRLTQRLTTALLLVWFVAGFVGVFFAAELRQRFFGWPLGFWIASQGALLVFLAIVAVYAWAMGRIDAATGLAEEEG